MNNINIISLIGYEQCKINDQFYICELCCVSSDYKNVYVEGDFENNHPMGSVNGIRNRNKNLVKVKANTLEKILNNHCNTNIDFLSLDTEGYELEILKGLNLNKYCPKFMLIEIYTKDYDNLIHFLTLHKYKLLSNFTNYNKIDNPGWDGTHNDYLFIDNR